MHPNVHCRNIYSSQDIEATQVSINRRMDKEDAVYTHTNIPHTPHTHTHTHNGVFLSYKKKEIMPFEATQMDLEITILSEVTQRKTNIITYMWNLIKISLFTKQKPTHRSQNQIMVMKEKHEGREKLGDCS